MKTKAKERSVLKAFNVQIIWENLSIFIISLSVSTMYIHYTTLYVQWHSIIIYYRDHPPSNVSNVIYGVGDSSKEILQLGGIVQIFVKTRILNTFTLFETYLWNKNWTTDNFYVFNTTFSVSFIQFYEDIGWSKRVPTLKWLPGMKVNWFFSSTFFESCVHIFSLVELFHQLIR